MEVEKKRLDEIQKEAQRREQSVRQALERNLQLVQELQLLGMSASEELIGQVEAQRNEIGELGTPESRTHGESSAFSSVLLAAWMSRG